jgi:hypothetical protein
VCSVAAAWPLPLLLLLLLLLQVLYPRCYRQQCGHDQRRHHLAAGSSTKPKALPTATAHEGKLMHLLKATVAVTAAAAPVVNAVCPLYDVYTYTIVAVQSCST